MRSAVIAVAPRTTPEERELLAKAATKCGIKSVSFIHSAISVLLAHGLDAPGAALGPDGAFTPMRQNVLVYRHGGRHVDVTVVSVTDGAFSVLSAVSDDSVGGLEFDEALVRHCTVEFRKKYRMDVSGSRALMRLRAACEEARRSLSINARVSIEVDSLFEGLDFATVITRPRFEDLCHALFRNVTKVCRRVADSCWCAPWVRRSVCCIPADRRSARCCVTEAFRYSTRSTCGGILAHASCERHCHHTVSTQHDSGHEAEPGGDRCLRRSHRSMHAPY